MQVCKKHKDQFIEALYGELDTNEFKRLQQHLEVCPKCREEYNQMQNTIKQMGSDHVPNPNKQFWDNYWAKLEERMIAENIQIENRAERKNIISLRPNVRAWTIRILSAAAMLLIGIGIGYLYFANPDPMDRSVSGQIPVKKAAYSQKAADYLEKSKILLLGFINFDTDQIDPTTMDFSRQQLVAKSLIRQAAVLKDDLKGKENQRVLALIQELEIILLQISNYEKEFDIPAIELIKSGVDNNALMMKINLEEIMRASSKESNQNANEKLSKKNIKEL